MFLAVPLPTPKPDNTLMTCQCGRLVVSMCAKCSSRSFVVESAKRRPGLLARLEREGGWRAFDAYDTAVGEVLRKLSRVIEPTKHRPNPRNPTLRHVRWGKRGEIDHTRHELDEAA